MSSLVLGFQEIDRTKLMTVGGKGANLGELSRIESIRVPKGFCISTEVFQRVVGNTPSIRESLELLSRLKLDERDKIREQSAGIRKLIEGMVIPPDVQDEIIRRLSPFPAYQAYAIRSSATAEDLPTASFAGQQDTYLNIIGEEAVLKHISRCWASLFTERAVIYRIQNDFDHRKVLLSVIVQKMVFAQAAGILFTADPVTGNRNVLSIDASFGLGEALVAGLVNADNYKVRQGNIVERRIGKKKLAIHALKEGGTKEQAMEPERQKKQTLMDEQILQLERIGRTIEKHFGSPQDIEWCWADDGFHIVQSRPITSLYPIPEASDQDNHVYVSVGHQQMMTDPMKPLGLSFFQLIAGRPMHKAGGRLFVDVTQDLASPVRRNMLVNVLGKSDPLIQDALRTILDRGDFVKEESPTENQKGPPPANYQAQIDYDPTLVPALIQRNQASLERLKHEIQSKTGTDLMDYILDDIQELKKGLFDPQSFAVIMTAMNASAWVNENIKEWLGEKNVADTLSQSVPHNITSEMGLALLDLADVIRPYPEVVAYLEQAKAENFWEGWAGLKGGEESRSALQAYLNSYGMRCAGEIDITKTRWSEKPTTLVPVLLSNIRNFESGAGKRKFERGREEALNKEQKLLARLMQLPDGQEKAQETKRKIELIRNYIGFREYPKYGMVQRTYLYKQALLKEAERLVRAKVIQEKEDIYFLTFEELREVISTHKLDKQIIHARELEYLSYEKLSPPRVITSEGEIIAGAYKRDNIPENAIVGLPVSAGVVEGRARVILRMEEADLEEGDILVTPFTDPSWTPLFVSIKGLVTEVGGLMTHGAVIAREYGLPAVVGVENACKLIQDGQRIRVHGTEGFVEIL